MVADRQRSRQCVAQTQLRAGYWCAPSGHRGGLDTRSSTMGGLVIPRKRRPGWCSPPLPLPLVLVAARRDARWVRKGGERRVDPRHHLHATVGASGCRAGGDAYATRTMVRSGGGRSSSDTA